MSTIPHYPIGPIGYDFSVEVKGAHFHREVLSAMFALEDGKDNQEFFVDVTLVPEPDNPHSESGSAISVRWMDRVVGYIPSGESSKYAQLRRVAASGYDASTKMRVWTNKSWDGERRFWNSVQLPEPDLLLPLNNPPADGYVLLPRGAKIQVTKEAEHIEHLADFVPPSGQGQVLVTLHRFEAGKTKHWEGVEVRLEGERVGELSRVSSEKFSPAVRHFEEAGFTVVARAIIKGSSIAAELVLVAAKAHELDEDLLETEETNALPRLIDFQADPRDYEQINRFQSRTKERPAEPKVVPPPVVSPEPETPEPATEQYARWNPNSARIEVDAAYFTAGPQIPAPPLESDSYNAALPHVDEVNRAVAWVLWVLLGLVGGHRYYLGNIGKGLLQTLTVGGLGIWWIIDAFLINRRVDDINSYRAPRVMF